MVVARSDDEMRTERDREQICAIGLGDQLFCEGFGVRIRTLVSLWVGTGFIDTFVGPVIKDHAG